MIKTLYDDAPVIVAWLRQMPASLTQYLAELREQEIKQLKQTKDLIDLGRSQGKLEFLDRFGGLVEELYGVVGQTGARAAAGIAGQKPSRNSGSTQ